MGISLTWLGQACFQIVDDAGTTVLCDPYDPKVGYPPRSAKPDVVTISHDHFDHNHLGWVQGAPAVWRTAGAHSAGAVRAVGVESFHDGEHGAKRGRNLIFMMEIGGLRVCHLGDLGHELDDAATSAIGAVDVLLVPVGGFYTIDAQQAARACDHLNPKLIVPMHFNPDGRQTPIAAVDGFAALVGAQAQGGSAIFVDRDSLRERRAVILSPLPDN